MVSQAGYEHLGLEWIPDDNGAETSEQISMDDVTK